jgi:hypothetical protein
MKADERRLLVELLKKRPKFGPPRADEIAAGIGIHPKRCQYLLEKWTSRGWWNYGVSARTGWFEQAGIEVALGILHEPVQELGRAPPP